MANLHSLFQQFNENITVSSSKLDKLITSRKALEQKIIKYFQENTSLKTPRFYIQGSYKMKTMILKSGNTYDVDLGVYILEKPDVSAKTVQKYIAEAVGDHTSGGAEHRNKCIRVIYSGEYNIDLPVYYKLEKENHPFLATKNNGWQESDPKELCDWYKANKSTDGQTGRIIKYLKAWCEQRSFKTPSGIAITVWVTTHFVLDTRDDVCLLKTIRNIKNKISFKFDCINPASPKDDLTIKLDDGQREKFKDALSSLIEAAELAIVEPNEMKSSKKWINQFGDRFPLGDDIVRDKENESLSSKGVAVITGKAFTDEKGRIDTNNSGIKNQPHKNYGK